MDKHEAEVSSNSVEDTSQLNRNRSFKSKQLVRSQAIRESTSPPRTASPGSPLVDAACERESNTDANCTRAIETTSETSSHISDDGCGVSISDNKVSDSDEYSKKQQVEIQITSGSWDVESSEQRQRTKRWLGHKHHSDSSRDLLSNSPRVTCVCGSCAACPYCRGRRRKHACPTKQDSGIVCSEDCPDCSDNEQSGVANGDGQRKSESLDVDDQFYCRCPERKDKPKNMSLSRTDSEDKMEPTGPDLVNFIQETLNKNARDRMTLLKIEKELHSLVSDTGRCIVRFPVMTSYGRMLVHRCAALFQLAHHLDHASKTAVLVSKSGTSGGRLPCTSFRQWCTATFPRSPQRPPASHEPHEPRVPHAPHAPPQATHTAPPHTKSILKRDTHSLDEPGAGARAAERSKSLEQRERDYERVRRRIFSTDNCNQDESQWPWVNNGPVKVLAPDTGRNKLLKVQSLESSAPQSWRGRGAVSKSHSFGGYGAGAGGEQTHQRLLSRQGDLASSSWRLSPSSSGYKTLSLRSTDSVTPSPTGGGSPEPVEGGPCMGVACAGGVLWAVTDMAAVPPGALVIHPQTGRPLTNPDGSLYHFDPTNPPILYEPGGCAHAHAHAHMHAHAHTEHPKPEQNEKKRGRLEKQHSFMDNECDCQPSEECRVKCCCECRRHEACQSNGEAEKPPTQNEHKTNENPTSPNRNRFESKPEPNSPSPTSANHRSYDTNQRPQESSQRNYELSNQGPSYSPNQRQSYESANQRAFENQRFEPANSNPQFSCQQPQFDSANQRPDVNRPVHKLVKQESQEMPQYVPPQNYVQGYRNDEVTSPPQQVINPYVQPDMANMPNMIPQAKVTPIPIPDPNIRPMSISSMVYPTGLPQQFTPIPYINQCRMEPPPANAYPPAPAPGPAPGPAPHLQDDHKQLAPSPHANESTFRIDPSYPFAPAPLEYGACGACAEPAPLHHRSYNMSYGPVEPPPTLLPPSYPLHNVLLPQHLQHYQYQEPLQWQNMAPVMPVASPPAPKLFVHELYPLVQYPPVYPHYNVMYPQMMPPPFPMCQPMFPAADKQAEVQRRNSMQRLSKRNSISGSARTTPQTPDDKRIQADCPNDKMPSNPNYARESISRQNSNEIAVKIQQIKDQMTQMNMRDRDRDREKTFRGRGPEDWKRRNSGNGILGNYPVNNFNGRIFGRPVNDESQLTSAARAIVNSIRSMQAKNTYPPDIRRNEYTPHQRNDNRQDRPEYRRREKETERGAERMEKPQSASVPNLVQRGASEEGPASDRRGDRARGVNVPFHYRPPYLLRQMSPGTWCRRSPGPVHPVLNQPRRPHPDRSTRR